MSIERDWQCGQCEAIWVSDFSQHRCPLCHSDEIEFADTCVSKEPEPRQALVNDPRVWTLASDLHTTLLRAGLAVERRGTGDGLTREMALACQLILDGHVKLEQSARQ